MPFWTSSAVVDVGAARSVEFDVEGVNKLGEFAGSHFENGAMSTPAGTYHEDASRSQRAPRDLASSFSRKGTLR